MILQGSNFPFSYWFLNGPYNSAARLRCLWCSEFFTFLCDLYGVKYVYTSFQCMSQSFLYHFNVCTCHFQRQRFGNLLCILPYLNQLFLYNMKLWDTDCFISTFISCSARAISICVSFLWLSLHFAVDSCQKFIQVKQYTVCILMCWFSLVQVVSQVQQVDKDLLLLLVQDKTVTHSHLAFLDKLAIL